jgi:hypothetical protein
MENDDLYDEQNGRVLSDLAADTIIEAIRDMSAQLAMLNARMTEIALAMRDLNAGTAHRLAEAACFRAGRAGRKDGAADSAAEPDTF